MSFDINALAIDVEEWFHICEEDIYKVAGNPDKLEERVCKNTETIVNLLKRYNQKASFFFVGWVAERYPELVKFVADNGFEIGCHSYSHNVIYKMTPKGFEEDLIKATEIIYKASNIKPSGYRAPGFSIKRGIEWYFDILTKIGYKYDASVFSTYRSHGGIADAPIYPYKLKTAYGEIMEFPQSVTDILGVKLCFSGGGYFRLLPLWFVESQIKRLNMKNVPVLFYIHPREIDPEQPRMKLSLWRYFKYYVNIDKTLDKFEQILKRFKFDSVENVLNTYF